MLPLYVRAVTLRLGGDVWAVMAGTRVVKAVRRRGRRHSHWVLLGMLTRCIVDL